MMWDDWLFEHILLLDTNKHMNISGSKKCNIPLQSRGQLLVPEISMVKHLIAKFEGLLTQVNKNTDCSLNVSDSDH